MAMKPAHALDEQIDRRQLGEEEIEVDVQALLDDLRGHHDTAALSCALLADKPLNFCFDAPPLAGQHAGVVEHSAGPLISRQGGEQRVDLLEGRLRRANRVADPSDRRSTRRRSDAICNRTSLLSRRGQCDRVDRAQFDASGSIQSGLW